MIIYIVDVIFLYFFNFISILFIIFSYFFRLALKKKKTKRKYINKQTLI